MNRLKRSQRGAALVETALVLPLLMILAIGTVEFGSLASDKMALQSASRSGARLAGSLGTNQKVDYFVLQAIKAVNLGNATLDYVMIYDPDPSVAPHGCTGGSTTGCNHYSKAQIDAADPADFTSLGDAGCNGSDPDTNYCPTSRSNAYPHPKEIAVAIVAHHNSITGLLFKNKEISSTLIVQLDPDTRTL